MELKKVSKKKLLSAAPVAGIDSKYKLSDEDIHSRIAVSAYYKAEARGYEPGHEVQDWLDAEAEIVH